MDAGAAKRASLLRIACESTLGFESLSIRHTNVLWAIEWRTENLMPKTILVEREGKKDFRITVPDDSKLTFGPWSPPTGSSRYDNSDRSLRGTLRVYKGTKSTENVIAVFSGVTGFRDITLEYLEKVATHEVSTMWKSDDKGYVQERSGKFDTKWVSDPDIPLIDGDGGEVTDEFGVNPPEGEPGF